MALSSKNDQLKEIMKIQTIHKISGSILFVFIALHIFNHMASINSIEKHIELMQSLRLIYRNIFVEAILLIAVFIQIFSGLKLFFVKKKTATLFFDRLQIWTGLYLSFFLLMHVSAVLGARFFLDLDTNFYFGVAGLNTFPFYIFFVPYYGLAIISFFGHVAAIHYLKMKKNIFGINPQQQAKFILGFGVVLTLLIFYGLTNQFNGVSIPSEYKKNRIWKLIFLKIGKKLETIFERVWTLVFMFRLLQLTLKINQRSLQLERFFSTKIKQVFILKNSRSNFLVIQKRIKIFAYLL